MKKLFYEDIQLLPHHDVQTVITWYERWVLKESRFLIAHKSEIGYELATPRSELALYFDEGVEYGATLAELETNLKTLGDCFKHKEAGERTEEVNAVIMKLDKNYPNWIGMIVEGYYFIDSQLYLYEKQKSMSNTAFIKMFFGEHTDNHHIRDDKTFDPQTDGKYRILFYEDLEEISSEVLDELTVWYDKRVYDLNAYYVEEHQKFRQRHTDRINKYDEGELNSVIRYSLNTITAGTQEDFVTALARQDYQFEHKAEGQRTEQPTAKLLKVTGDGQLERYVFLGLKEHVCPVPESDRYNEQDRVEK